METVKTKKTFYDKDGLSTNNEDKSCCYLLEGNTKTYFVRMDMSRRLYNPQELTSLKEKRLGQERWQWKKTTEEIFVVYLRFLSTKNALYFRDAERMVMKV